MKVIDLCEAEDISFDRVQKALQRLHDRGHVEGFIPNDPEADIKISRKGLIYMCENGELNKEQE